MVANAEAGSVVEGGGVLGEVLSGAEGAAGTGDHHRPHSGVSAGLGDGVEELGLQLGGQGVAPVWAVEGDRRDRPGAIHEQHRSCPTPLGHGGIL